jgi:hypothetical protein
MMQLGPSVNCMVSLEIVPAVSDRLARDPKNTQAKAQKRRLRLGVLDRDGVALLGLGLALPWDGARRLGEKGLSGV